MGESTHDPAVARRVTEELGRLAKSIGQLKLNSSISLDLPHVGMAIDRV
jgi:hypothetical protein